MEKRFVKFSALLAGLLICSPNAIADQYSDLIDAAMKTNMNDWSFETTNRTIGGLRYRLDKNLKLAKWMDFASENSAPESIEIPDTIRYNDELYVVVATGYSSGYSQYRTKKIVLPNTMRRLGEHSLSNYRSLRCIDLPESIEYIERYAFYNMNNCTVHFTGEKVPEVAGSLTYSTSYKIKILVPTNAFKEYSLTDYIRSYPVISDNIDDNTVITGKVDNGELGYIVVADKVTDENPQVRTYRDVNKLVISEGTIDETDFAAIRKMPNLIELDMKNLSIKDIPYGALQDCWQIERIILPDSLVTMAGYALSNIGAKEIIFPEGFRKFTGSYSLSSNDSLRSISFPEGVETINSYLCYHCDSLKSVHFPSTLTGLNANAFMYCDLRSVNIPGGVKTIGSECFRSNTRLKKVTFNEGLNTVNSYAFMYCSSIDSITLPSTVKSLKGYAFANIDSIRYVGLNEGLESMEGYTFQNCPSLKSIVIPSSMEMMTGRPFYNTPLKRIESRAVLPPTVRSECIVSSYSKVELWVPEWSFQEYMVTPGWLQFQDYINIITDNMPENLVINKDFEFVLKQNAEDYEPNIKMEYNTERIDDGFGNTKYERGNMIISSRSKLKIGDFSMYVSPYAKYYADYSRFYSNVTYDSHQTTFNPNSLVVRGEMRAENQTLNLMLYNNRWQFISFPFDVKVSSIIPDNADTQWVVRYYDGYERAQKNFDQTWKNLDADDILQAGRGYIMMCYLNNPANDLVNFTVTPVKESLTRQYLFTHKDRTIGLEENLSEFEQNRSWNLIGNPYPCYFDSRYMDTESPFMVWDSYSRKYVAMSPVDDDYIFNPGEAFFIQRPVDQDSLTFIAEGRQTYRNPNDLTVNPVQAANGRFMAESSRQVYNFVLSMDSLSDATRIVMNDKALATYEVSRDAAKFMAESAVPQIWTVQGGVQYAINERPLAEGEVELAMICPSEGTYTIEAAKCAAGKIVLEDRATGISTILSDGLNYSFKATAGQIDGRFFLQFASENTTGIENADMANDNTPLYNAAGQRVNSNAKGIVIGKDQKRLNK